MGERSVQLARRQRAGRFNRKLGYVSLPLLVATSVIYYIPGSTAHLVSAVCQIIFLPMFFVHVALSFYVFGLVRPRRTLRVFHIYFGYATFFIVFASQMTIHYGGWVHGSLTALMYLAIAVHIGIGLRYGMARRSTEVPTRSFSAPKTG
jgi:hypothetical protein